MGDLSFAAAGGRFSWIPGRSGLSVQGEGGGDIESENALAALLDVVEPPADSGSAGWALELWLGRVSASTPFLGTVLAATTECDRAALAVDGLGGGAIASSFSTTKDGDCGVPGTSFRSPSVTSDPDLIHVAVRFARAEPIGAGPYRSLNQYAVHLNGRVSETFESIGSARATLAGAQTFQDPWRGGRLRVLPDDVTDLAGHIYSLAVFANVTDADLLALHAAGPPNSPPAASDFTQDVPEDTRVPLAFCDPGPSSSSTCLDYEARDNLSDSFDLVASAAAAPAGRRLRVKLFDVDQVRGTLTCGQQPCTENVAYPLGSVEFQGLPDEHSYTITLDTELRVNASAYTALAFAVVDPEGAESPRRSLRLQVRPTPDAPLSVPQSHVEVGAWGARGRTEIVLRGEHVPLRAEVEGQVFDGFEIVSLPAEGVLRYSLDRISWANCVAGGVYGSFLDAQSRPACVVQYEPPLGSPSGARQVGSDSFEFRIRARALSADLANPESLRTFSVAPARVDIDLLNPIFVGGTETSLNEDGFLVGVTGRAFELPLQDERSGVLVRAAYTYEILSLPERGRLYQSGGLDPLAAVPVNVTNSRGRIEFQGDPNGFGEAYAAFSYRAIKNGGESSAPGTVVLDVREVNDPPVLNLTRYEEDGFEVDLKGSSSSRPLDAELALAFADVDALDLEEDYKARLTVEGERCFSLKLGNYDLVRPGTPGGVQFFSEAGGVQGGNGIQGSRQLNFKGSRDSVNLALNGLLLTGLYQARPSGSCSLEIEVWDRCSSSGTDCNPQSAKGTVAVSLVRSGPSPGDGLGDGSGEADWKVVASIYAVLGVLLLAVLCTLGCCVAWLRRVVRRRKSRRKVPKNAEQYLHAL
jgi:hypothetical protein